MGAFTTISENRGDPCRPSPGIRGLPIDSSVSGSSQSTQPAYASGSSPSAAVTFPAPSSAVNAATDYRKKWRRRKGLSLEEGPIGPEGLRDEGPRPERLAHGRELGERIEEAIGKLPEKYRTMLVLREYEGLSYGELSRVLGLRKGTVESRLFRARERLKALLEPYM